MAQENQEQRHQDNVIMACHITGVHDVNRNTILADDDYELVRIWAESVANAKVKGILFHNHFSDETCERYQNDCISFVKIGYNPQFNPNVYRYLIYKNFLQKNLKHFRNIFITDVSDVVLVKNPFTDPFFLEHPNSIFCGDEPKPLCNEWMMAHSASLREKISDYAEYEKKFANETLLNCGVIGGAAPIFFHFLQQLCNIHQQANSENKTAYTGDMGAFNYLARTQFNAHLKHGAPINTIFKSYESERMDCWFRHK
jgi:hypothetical protein